MKTQKQFRAMPPGSHQQSGYIMLLVAIFLLILMAGSAQLFGRIAEDTITSGTLRDSTESLMVADTAMENLRGQFIGTLDTLPIDQFDEITARQLPANIANPDAILFPYMYYVTAGAGLDQTQPSILQKIADGESIGTAAATLAARSIPVATNQLRMNDLFAAPGGAAPLLFTVDADTGLLTGSGAASWDGEANAAKVAAWIEVFQNAGDATSVDLFVQAMSQVGNAKSYVQRYVGTYPSSSTVGVISALSESSGVNRTGP